MINLHEIQMLDTAPSYPIFTTLLCDLEDSLKVSEAKQVVHQSKELSPKLRDTLIRYLSGIDIGGDIIFLEENYGWIEEYKTLPVLSRLIIATLIPVWDRPHTLNVDFVRKAAIAKINLAVNLIIDLEEKLPYFNELSGVPEENISLVKTDKLRGSLKDYHNCSTVTPETQSLINTLTEKYNHIHFEIAERLGFPLDSDALEMFTSKTRYKNPIIHIGRVGFAVSDSVNSSMSYEELPRELVDAVMERISA